MTGPGTRIVVRAASPPLDFEIREGSAQDFAGIARLSEAVHGGRRSIAGIRWIYENNPAGRCALWLAEDRRTRQIVGLRPVFPWRLQVGGRQVRAVQAGDAMTHPEFRGRGIFSALVETAWARLRAQGIPFAFSFSTPGSLSVYHKMTRGAGAPITHQVLRFVRLAAPLSLRALGARVSGLDWLVAGADVAYRAGRRLRLRLPTPFTAFTVERFGAEFDRLWAQSAGDYGVLTVRDSAYLNWRFIEPPSGRFHVLGLRSGDTLVGYVAFEVDAQRCGWIADIFGFARPGVITALLKAALDAMAQLGCVKASIWAVADGRFSPLLRRVGFVPRGDSCPMAVHVYQAGAQSTPALDCRQWLAWFADRDIEHLAGGPLGGS